MNDPTSIALVRLSHLGDVVLALPLFHALRERFPRARLAWVVQSEFAGLLDGLGGLDRIVRFERRGGASAWLALQRELASLAPQLAVDAQGNYKSALATLVSGAPRRVGVAPRDWRERGAWLAMTEFAEALSPSEEHAMDRTRALVEHLCGSRELRRDPALGADELERGRRELDARCGTDAAPLIVQLSDERDVRAWPLERALELARDSAAAGWRVLLLSGPSEEAQGHAAAEHLRAEPRVAHWVAQRGLRQLAALFSAAAERGACYVGPDTGPTHLAAACGLRVVVLAGPQSHLRTGPWPVAEPSARGASPHRVVRSPLALDCAPCLERSCRRADGPLCMRSIEPAAVLALAQGAAAAASTR